MNTKKQTKAAQAMYTPNLDVRVAYLDQHFAVEIINRGKGTAKDIELLATVCIDESGYEHTTRFSCSLESGYGLHGEGGTSAIPEDTRDRLDLETIVCWNPTIEVPNGPEESDYLSLFDLLNSYSSSEEPETAWICIEAVCTDIIETKEYVTTVKEGRVRIRGDSFRETFREDTLAHDAAPLLGQEQSEKLPAVRGKHTAEMEGIPVAVN
jgi:hypothetical protein